MVTTTKDLEYTFLQQNPGEPQEDSYMISRHLAETFRYQPPSPTAVITNQIHTTQSSTTTTIDH